MFITTQSYLPNATLASNTASFRDWVYKMDACFSSIGLVNTIAIGGVNDSASIAALVPPNAADVYRGYQVWRFNDTLHMSSSYPVYIKVEYGSKANNGGGPAVALTVGFTHDGSGTIGPLPFTTDRNTGGGQSFVSGTLYTIRACGVSGSDFGFLYGEEVAANGCMFGVERLKNGDGTPSTQGIVVWISSAIVANDKAFEVLPYNNTKPGHDGGTTVPFPIVLSSLNPSSVGADVSFCPFIPIFDGYYPPSIIFAAVRSNDFTVSGTQTFNLYSTSSVYWLSANTAFQNMDLRGLASSRLCMRYE